MFLRGGFYVDFIAHLLCSAVVCVDTAVCTTNRPSETIQISLILKSAGLYRALNLKSTEIPWT